MTIKVLKVTILCLVLFIIGYTQQDITDKKSCKEILKEGLDTVSISDTHVSYKIVEFYKSSEINSKGQPIFELTVILPDHDSNSNKNEINKILYSLPLKPGSYNLTVFKTCSCMQIFYQAMKWLPKQEKRFKEEFIGIFKIKI